MTPRQKAGGTQAQIMKSNQHIIAYVRDAINPPGEIRVDNVAGMISDDLANRLKDPKQRESLLRDLREAHPEYQFKGINIIGSEGDYHIQVSMSKFALSTNSEVIEDVQEKLSHGDINRIEIPITHELYQQLQDPKNQEAFIRAFAKANSDLYTCTTTIIPPFQTRGRSRNYQIRLDIKKTPTAAKTMRSTQDIINKVGEDIKDDNLMGTAMLISEKIANKLYDPQHPLLQRHQQEALLRQLREAYPAYDFTKLRVLYPGQAGDNNHHLQIEMKLKRR